MEKTLFSLKPVPPYDFELTAAYSTYFRGNYGTDQFHDGVFRRLLGVGDALCLASVSSSGVLDFPEVRVELTHETLKDEIFSVCLGLVSRVLGLDQCLDPFYSMADVDPALSEIARTLRGLHLPQTATVFEALVLSIVGQGISAQAAKRLREVLIQAYGPSAEIAGRKYYAFPYPDRLAGAGMNGLRSIGLTKAKAESVLSIATELAEGRLDLESLRGRPDEEAIRILTGIKGVGPWTAQWVLIRGLGRPDGFPCTDIALLRAIAMLLGKEGPVKPSEALEYSLRWSPYRSFVTAYLFAAYRMGMPNFGKQDKGKNLKGVSIFQRCERRIS
jgi:DNA-3-methyladenine glycosylase II